MSMNGKRKRIEISDDFDIEHMKLILIAQEAKNPKTPRTARAIINGMSHELIRLHEMGWDWDDLSRLLRDNGFVASSATIRQYVGRSKRDRHTHARSKKPGDNQRSVSKISAQKNAAKPATKLAEKFATQSDTATITETDTLFEMNSHRARYSPPSDDASSKYD